MNSFPINKIKSLKSPKEKTSLPKLILKYFQFGRRHTLLEPPPHFNLIIRMNLRFAIRSLTISYKSVCCWPRLLFVLFILIEFQITKILNFTFSLFDF